MVLNLPGIGRGTSTHSLPAPRKHLADIVYSTEGKGGLGEAGSWWLPGGLLQVRTEVPGWAKAECGTRRAGAEIGLPTPGECCFLPDSPMSSLAVAFDSGPWGGLMNFRGPFGLSQRRYALQSSCFFCTQVWGKREKQPQLSSRTGLCSSFEEEDPFLLSLATAAAPCILSGSFWALDPHHRGDVAQGMT